jgi:hypothetical protein
MLFPRGGGEKKKEERVRTRETREKKRAKCLFAIQSKKWGGSVEDRGGKETVQMLEIHLPSEKKHTQPEQEERKGGGRG